MLSRKDNVKRKPIFLYKSGNVVVYSKYIKYENMVNCYPEITIISTNRIITRPFAPQFLIGRRIEAR
jgi:hypothetical protein